MKSMMVSLPPLAEQKRIYHKVNELSDFCERLKKSIRSSRSDQLYLTDVIVEQAV